MHTTSPIFRAASIRGKDPSWDRIIAAALMQLFIDADLTFYETIYHHNFHLLQISGAVIKLQ
jgi:hypothetical protein